MKLDRNSFKSGNIFETKKESSYYFSMTLEERAKVFAYLQSVAYNYEPGKPPRLERNIHSVR